MAQFEIKRLVPLELFGYDISFTNSALWMAIAVVLVYVLVMLGSRHASMVPGRLQALVELIYEFIGDMIGSTIGKGDGRTAATVGGAVAGGFAGNAIERNQNRGYGGREAWQFTVRLDNGRWARVTQWDAYDLRPGDRVMIRDNRLMRLR